MAKTLSARRPHDFRQPLPLTPRAQSTGRRDGQGVRHETRASQRAAKWRGAGAFYVQIERCGGVAKQCASVRHDDEKYHRYSNAVKEAVERCFDGQIPVEIIDVSTLYALEVRVMPEECHPKYRPAVVAGEAEEVGGFTVFSKIASKKWPQCDALIRTLQQFCRVPVRLLMLGRELRAASAPEHPEVREVHRAVNKNPAGVESLAALRRVEFRCTNERGFDLELSTGTDGRADIPLCPGSFQLSFLEGSGYDTLSPNLITVPGNFSGLEITITASMMKKCTFCIVDHLHKPFGFFPLRLVHRDQRVPPVSLRTKVDGKCRGRLARGNYTLSYDGESEDSNDWPITPLQQDIEVLDTEIPQVFRINVQRIRFTCSVMLRTRFQEPAAYVPFKVRDVRSHVVFAGMSSEIAVATCELPAGAFNLQLTANEDSPFVQTSFEIRVNEDGTFTPMEYKVMTKTTDVQINLVTPDGEPAPDCLFYLEPQFQQTGTTARTREMKVHTDATGVAFATMAFLEPYTFRVKPTGKAAEYMPQQFVFQTSRREVTIVVARSIFGSIMEDNVALVIDTSGSMQVYIEDVKTALIATITEQFYQSDKKFNVVTYTERNLGFRHDLVDCTKENLEDAMRFCDAIEAGGGSELSKALEHAFSFQNLEAMYIVTDGKTEMKDMFLNQVRSMYFMHPKRPKLNTIGINCVPRRLTWQGLQAVALLTQGIFRPVCLQQDSVEAIARHLPLPGDSAMFSPFDLAPATSGAAGGTDDEALEESYDDQEFEAESADEHT